MPKEFTWALIIVGAIFFGNLLYEQYAIYRAQKLVEAAVGDFQQTVGEIATQQQLRRAEARRMAEKRKQQVEAEKAAKMEIERQAEFDKTTACGINEDTQTCTCLNMKTNGRVTLEYDECARRARNNS